MELLNARNVGLISMREKVTGQRRNRSMNYLAIVVAAGAAFVASLVWYTVFGKAMMELSRAADTGASVWTMLFVIAQSLIVAFMVAYFVSRVGITGFAGAAGLGALLRRKHPCLRLKRTRSSSADFWRRQWPKETLMP